MALRYKTRKGRLKSAFTYVGYQPVYMKDVTKKIVQKTIHYKLAKIKAWLKRKEAPTPPHKSYHIFAGPIKGKQRGIIELMPDGVDDLTPDMKTNIEQNWKPYSQLTVFDHHQHRPLTAAESATKRIEEARWMPQYFQNPMQGYDYLVYESLLKNTILGPLLWNLVRFIVGGGFKPKLIINRPSGDKKKDSALIEKHQYVLDNLSYVDRAISKTEGGIDISLTQKINNMFYNTLGFNRSVLVKKFDGEPYMLDLKGDGKIVPVKGLPTGLVDFHPRDIGIVKVSPKTHKMESVQISQIQGFVPMDQMIYMWNSQHGAPIFNAKFYGGSILMPTIEPGRIVQAHVSSIFPAISENMAGGLYHIFIKPEGGTDAQKAAEYSSIAERTQYGTANILMIDPDRVKYENVNFDPKISELIQMFETNLRYMVACFNLPQFGFYDEAAANHATAVERVQLAMSTTIGPTQDWMGEAFGLQWYDYNFRVMYKDDPDLLDTFTIGVEFEDLQIETLQQRAETLDTLAQVGISVDDEKKEELLRIEGLADHIEDVPMDMQQNKNFTVKTAPGGQQKPVGSGGGGKSGTSKYKVKQQ